MTNTPKDWGGAPLGPSVWTDMPQRMLHQVAFRAQLDRFGCVIEPPSNRLFRPATPLTGLALRLLAVSNAFHECRSDRID
jgi:hypothetical protein